MNSKKLEGFDRVRLEDAVLCADCDIVSAGPTGYCCACGSHALLNLSRVLGGCLRSASLSSMLGSRTNTRNPRLHRLPFDGEADDSSEASPRLHRARARTRCRSRCRETRKMNRFLLHVLGFIPVPMSLVARRWLCRGL